jgi:hypothetical protein
MSRASSLKPFSTPIRAWDICAPDAVEQSHQTGVRMADTNWFSATHPLITNIDSCVNWVNPCRISHCLHRIINRDCEVAKHEGIAHAASSDFHWSERRFHALMDFRKQQTIRTRTRTFATSILFHSWASPDSISHNSRRLGREKFRVGNEDPSPELKVFLFKRLFIRGI